jgi:hypothetical protein
MRFNVPCYVQRDNASQRKLTSRRADKISETHSRACRKGSRDPNAAIVGILSMKIHYMSASRSASRRIVEMLLWNLNWYGRSGDRKSYAPLTIHKLVDSLFNQINYYENFEKIRISPSFWMITGLLTRVPAYILFNLIISNTLFISH